MMVAVIAGIIFIIIGVWQIIHPTRLYTDNPEVQPYFRPERYSLFNIAVSLAMIIFGFLLIFYSIKIWS